MFRLMASLRGTLPIMKEALMLVYLLSNQVGPVRFILLKNPA